MSNLETNREIAGRYRVVRFIGQGGMGAVYEVEHLHTGQRLAMKVLAGQHHGLVVERFKREARAASRIQSDHVVRITDADVAPELGESPFLVMELLDGADLEHATGGGPAPPADVVEWLRQVARALSKAHEAGIVHRDLKPENLFLTRREDGTPLVKILDFGIAKLTEEGGGLTQSNQFVGTPAYMAPEQADPHGPAVTAAADLFALGLIAFRLLAGRSYWMDGTLAQMLAQVLTQPMAPASERGSTFGPAFDAWFARACERDPSKRFTSAVEQVEALATALELPAQQRAATPAATSRPALTTLETAPTLGASSRATSTHTTLRGRATWVFAAAGAVLAIAAAVLVPQLRSRPQPAPVPSPAPLSTAAAAVTPTPAGPVTLAPAPSAAPAGDAAPPASVAIAPAVSIRPVVKPPPPPARKTDAGRDPLEGQY